MIDDVMIFLFRTLMDAESRVWCRVNRAFRHTVDDACFKERSVGSSEWPWWSKIVLVKQKINNCYEKCKHLFAN